MSHAIYRVVDFEIVGPYTLRIVFDDETEQVINFLPILNGPVFGQLRDENVFNQVRLDPEVHTLVWPNGADFDPETLHNWQKFRKAMERMSKRWAKKAANLQNSG